MVKKIIAKTEKFINNNNSMAKKNQQASFIKSDLIQELSQKHNTTKSMATLIVDSILDSITNTLKKGNRVEIRGLGTFELREYEAYEGRNPQTGEKIQVKAKKLPFFKPGKFKDQINKSRS